MTHPYTADYVEVEKIAPKPMKTHHFFQQEGINTAEDYLFPARYWEIVSTNGCKRGAHSFLSCLTPGLVGGIETNHDSFSKWNRE